MIPRRRDDEKKSQLLMTPMIDIVFQLLIFFIMTFKITAPEGDFYIDLPISGIGREASEWPPIHVRLSANDEGKLTEIRVNGQTSFGTDFQRLREFVVKYVGADTSPTSPRETGEVHLECDYALHYEHVIDALTHCSRSLDEDGNIVQLIKTIRFAPPKKQTRKQTKKNPQQKTLLKKPA